MEWMKKRIMRVDSYGVVSVSQQQLIDFLRAHPLFDFEGISLTDGEEYLAAKANTLLDVPNIFLENSANDLSPTDYHAALQEHWLMPPLYAAMDIGEKLRELCHTPEELSRVNMEFKLYEEHNLINLLRYLKYLRDVASDHNIVWGVGRGSSCCSYCLFLLKIHLVDSIKYDLDIHEFLRR